MIVTIDFETHAIVQRPDYPPHPVGVSIKRGDEPSRYYAFGHLSGGNNCTEAEARATLADVWALPWAEMLFFNAKFDVAVAVERWGLPMPEWQQIHDSQFLAFLLDPHARSGGLKALAHSWLNWPPDEQDEVVGWIWEHRARILEATGERVASRARTGAHIWTAPGDLVGRYACGDTDRTKALFDEMLPLVERCGMREAYDRERQLLPILMLNEREGLHVDMEALERDVSRYQRAFEFAEEALRQRLGAPGLNFDADEDVSAILLDRGVVPQENWALTKTGRLSMSKENLHPDMFADKQVAQALGYRNRLATCLKMFMEPWLAQASRTGGTIHTNWNQIRGTESGGTRTGRPSTNNPNLLNISKSFDGRDDGYQHPDFLGLPPLPLCRRYIRVRDGYKFVHRDFNGQELRLFGHFEQGDLYQQYHADPRTDVHAFVGTELMRVAQREIERTRVKTLNFQGIYGGGVPALQRKLRCSAAEAKELKAFHDRALPGRKILVEEIKRCIKRGLPVRTIGGRLYFCEPPGPDGRSKDYKLINYIIQGSAADLTKQVIIEWDEWNRAQRHDLQARFLIQVYDEINIEAPIAYVPEHMGLLRKVMEMPRLGITVPILSDGKLGLNWGELEKYADEP